MQLSTQGMEVRQRIAKGAANQLIGFIKQHQAKDNLKIRTNMMALMKHKGKVNPKFMLKTPLCRVDKYVNVKNEYFIDVLQTTTMSRTRDLNEWFEDEGLFITCYDRNSKFRVSITRHAIERAFERGWHLFKGKSETEWIDLFFRSASAVRSEYANHVKSLKQDDSTVIPFDALDAVVQMDSTGVIILTYVPPTNPNYSNERK